MRFIWNLLAVVGLVVVVASVGGAAYVLRDGTFKGFDPKSVGVYRDMATKLVKTGSLVDASIWRTKVADGLTFAEVDQSIRTVANENNIKAVGELPLYKQVEALTGKPARKIVIYLFCNPLTAAKMLEHSDAFSVNLPCRIALLEDKKGQLWIYSLNMDPMIYGGRTLPDGLKKEAVNVKRIMRDIMNRAASGDF